MNDILVFFTCLCLSYFISQVVCRYGKQLKILDDLSSHKHPKVIHQTTVPRGGGIPISITVIVLLLLFAGLTLQTIGIITGIITLAVTGFIDDRFEEKFSPYTRLILNIAAAVALVISGVSISFITNPFGGILYFGFWISAGLTIFWLVWMQNIVGWSSGVDGQLPGFVIVAAITMALLGLRFGAYQNQTLVVILALATAGSYAGFLPFNWYPQKCCLVMVVKVGWLSWDIGYLSSAKVGAMVLVWVFPSQTLSG